jgi:hypothetical protein
MYETFLFLMAQHPLVGQGLLIIALYLTTHNTHNRQTSMPPAGFETTMPANEWPQTHALDRAANTYTILLGAVCCGTLPCALFWGITRRTVIT